MNNGFATRSGNDKEGDQRNTKFMDSLNNSVSPTRQGIYKRKEYILEEDPCKTENEDSLEENIVSEKTSVEKDSLTDTNENVKSNHNAANLNNAEGYFDSITGQDDYTITESEGQKQNEQPPKVKKLVLPTSISFNDSFSSDTSPFNTSLDVSIDSVNNPPSERKEDNGTTLDSLEHQIKSSAHPVLNRIQNGGLPNNNNSFEISAQNRPTFTVQQTPHILPPGGVHFGAGSHAIGVPKNPTNYLSNDTIEPSIGTTRQINLSAATPPNHYANAPRPILSNTSFLYGKTAIPYYGYGHNLHLYDVSGNNIDGPQLNNNRTKLQQVTPPIIQSRSPTIARSQTHPIPHQPSQGGVILSDHQDECSVNVIKEGSQHRPVVVLNPQMNALPQTIAPHQNQSVVKMAAERMKRKFLGWN